jgi:hypothetical protein
MTTPNPDAKTYEMLWDCKFCGTKKLLGKTHRFCPNCGAQQDPAARYFPADEDKVAVQDHVYYGADKMCPACKTPNSAQAEFCGNCGSPLDKAAAAQLMGERRKAETETFSESKPGVQPVAAATAAPKASGGSSRLWIILAVIGLLACGGILFAMFSTRSATIVVAGHRWEREIRINTLQSLNGRGSCDSLPANAYNVETRREQVDTRSVPDGETCQNVQIDQGDGTFREERQCQTVYRDEPVYGDVCYYNYNQWVYDRSVTTDGDKAVQPYWAEASIQSGTCLGCEQEAGRDEAYYLVFTGEGGNTFECEVSKEVWDSTPVERSFQVEVGTVTRDFRCDTLQPAG